MSSFTALKSVLVAPWVRIKRILGFQVNRFLFYFYCFVLDRAKSRQYWVAISYLSTK